MNALRFLATDHWDPIAGATWSTAWVEPAGGVIAYPAEALHHWIAPTLWQVEIAGNLIVRELSIRADRGRLVAPVEAWDEWACRDFVRWCCERYPDIDEADSDGTATEEACVTGYAATRRAGMAAVDKGSRRADGESAEREHQIAWVRGRAAV